MTHALKATASARANIALVKYWGKRDAALNLPAVGSLSITLDALRTITSVCFDAALPEDTLVFVDAHRQAAPARPTPAQQQRVSQFLDRVRERAGLAQRAQVLTCNTFPTGAGLASSASGFAALALAATTAAGVQLSAPELSVLARRGSGSAARSLFGGFVEMHRGVRPDGTDAFAEPLLAAEAWPLRVLIAITTEEGKAIGSTEGMGLTATTSPFYAGWLASWEDDVTRMRAAVLQRDFEGVAEVAEHSCLKMHGLMLSARPGLLYWNGATVTLVHEVRRWRRQGVAAFFTIDAGPQVKVVCLPEDVERLRAELQQVPGVTRVIETGLGPGAMLESEHLDVSDR